jgi:hypothetical protein
VPEAQAMTVAPTARTPPIRSHVSEGRDECRGEERTGAYLIMLRVITHAML